MAPLLGVNLMDWLGEHGWAIWLGAALLLGVAEIFTLDFVLIMVAAGALAGAVTAAIAPHLWWLQIGVAAAVSVLMLLLLRPTLLEKVRRMPGYRSALDKMVGSSGVATARITRRGGEVKVNGETWSARTFDATMEIEAGEEVEVYEVDGAVAVVYPVRSELA